jgi:hypothetical protein
VGVGAMKDYKLKMMDLRASHTLRMCHSGDIVFLEKRDLKPDVVSYIINKVDTKSMCVCVGL